MWAAPTEVAGAPGEPDDPYDSLEEAPEDFWERPNLEKGTIRRLRQRLFVPSPMGLPWFGQLAARGEENHFGQRERSQGPDR